jgi:hypothetical protein
MQMVGHYDEGIQLYPTMGPHVTQAVYQDALYHIALKDVSFPHGGCGDKVERFRVEINFPTWHKLSSSRSWRICNPALQTRQVTLGLQILGSDENSPAATALPFGYPFDFAQGRAQDRRADSV